MVYTLYPFSSFLSFSCFFSQPQPQILVYLLFSSHYLDQDKLGKSNQEMLDLELDVG